MNIKEIRELIQLIEESTIEEFEMERSGVRIRVRKTMVSPLTGPPQALPTSSRDVSETEVELTKNYIFSICSSVSLRTSLPGMRGRPA